MVVHVFLFSDMLLITKTRGADRYVIIRPVSLLMIVITLLVIIVY